MDMLLRNYIKRMDVSPRVKPMKGEVYEIRKGIEIEGKSEEDIRSISNQLARQIQRFPFGSEFKFIVLCREIPPKLPSHEDPRKEEFWRRYEAYLNKNLRIYTRDRFLVCEKGKGELMQKELKQNLGLELSEGRKNLNRVLAHFFGGDEEDPVWYPIESWEYGVRIGDIWGAVLMELEVPSEVYPFHMDVLNYISYDYIYCTNFKVPNPIEIEGMLSALRTMIAKQAHDPAMREVLSEIVEVQKDLELEREKMVFATTTLTLFADSPEEALERARNAQRTLAKYNLKFEIEGTIEHEAFMQLFEWDEKFCKSTNLIRKYISSAFSQMLPVSSLTKGSPTGMFFLNSGSEPCYVDLMHAMPPNMIELGQMGAGKSLLGMYLGLYSDLITFVEKIQEGAGSYTVFTKFFGGEYYPISLDRPLSLNPFGRTIYTIDSIALLEDLGYNYREMDESDIVLLRDILHAEFFYDQPERITKEQLLTALGKYNGTDYLKFLVEDGRWKNNEWTVKYDIDRDKLSTIKTIISLMLDLGGTSFDPAEIDEIVVATYKKIAEKTSRMYSDREVVISDFQRTAQMLKKHKIATRLATYTMQGAFGNFFDRPSDVKFNPTTFYEIRTREEEILPIAVMSILNNTVKFYSKPTYAKKRKGILLDEAWLFINHPLVVKWLEEAIRTYRKKGIFITLASQMAKDFTQGAGAFLKANSPYKFFLYSEEHTNIGSAFELCNEEVEILKNIKRPKEYGYRYAKYYVKTPYGQGSMFFIPSREFYWLATTDPADRVKREDYRRRILETEKDPQKRKNALFEAIKLLAEEDSYR